jgi:hypothetical protein
MDKKLPVYEMVIDEDQEALVYKTSFVKDPAFMRSFMAFSKQSKIHFEADDEQMVVTGPMLVPGLPIYRREETGDEFYVTINAANVRKAAFAYLKKGFATAVNVEHSQDVAGVFMVESFIIDEKRGISTPQGFDKQPEGTWFASFKVDNPDVWAKVKSGEFTGFSIEGLFDLQKITNSPESQLQQVIDIINQAEK